MAMKGVTISATADILFTPPNTTSAMRVATNTPITHGAIWKVVEKDMAMLLLWMGGRQRAHASTVTAAKSMASQRQRSPFSM